MNPDSIIDHDLPQLKTLASALLAAEEPPVDVLDEIAVLASAIAARWRDATRQRLVDQVMAEGGALLPAASGNLGARLADASLDELSGLAELLGAATVAQTAFERTDADLMAARERGEYAAMAPLAIEADSHRSALAAATAAFAERIDRLPLKADPPTAEPAEPEAAATAEPAANPIALAVMEGEDAPMLDETEASNAVVVDLDRRPTSQAERRRIRDLIRQMRTSEEAS